MSFDVKLGHVCLYGKGYWATMQPNGGASWPGDIIKCTACEEPLPTTPEAVFSAVNEAFQSRLMNFLMHISP